VELRHDLLQQFRPGRPIPILIQGNVSMTPRPGERSVKDELTGLLAPASFRLLVEHELQVARRYQRLDTFLVIDVENLKSVNAVFGREGGDETLRTISQLLQRTARESDIIGRIGDDEFAIFALDCNGDALAKRVSSAVARAVGGTGRAERRPLPVRLRIGITELRPGEEFDDLIARAGPAAFLRTKDR
ncbi:MAG: GGDEF domain-containing protein, partial [Gemmatimonadaceae bacterium]